MPLTITDYFQYLRAPLKNKRWSWGAVRQEDQALFLRVWDDESVTHNGARFYRLTAYEEFTNKPKDLGWQERLRHLELLQSPSRSAPAFLVICTAKDAGVSPRSIKGFDKSTVFLGGDLIKEKGDWWLQACSRLTALDARGLDNR